MSPDNGSVFDTKSQMYIWLSATLQKVLIHFPIISTKYNQDPGDNNIQKYEGFFLNLLREGAGQTAQLVKGLASKPDDLV